MTPRVWNKRDPNCPKDAVYVGRPSKWRATLHDAGMTQLVPAVLTEAVNTATVDRLCQTSGEFHKAVATLITEKAGKAVLRFGFARDGK